MLTDLGRRVLGHLPVYAADEAEHVEAEGGAEVSIRSYRMTEMVDRLAEDPHISPVLGDAAVEAVLIELRTAGFCSERAGRWRMTKRGLAAIEAPAEVIDPPGVALVDLAPVKLDGKARV